MESQGKGINKSAVLVGLFAATALAVSTGCSSQPAYSSQDVCRDDDGDGYCDDDHSAVDHGHFVYIGGHKTFFRQGRYDSATYGSSGASGSGSSTGKPGTSNSTDSNSSVKPPSSSSGSGTVIGRGSSTGGVSSGKSGIGSSGGSSSS